MNYAEKFYEYVKGTKEYTCLTSYISTREKVLMRHNVCGYEWNISPNSFKSKGTRCPNCAGNAKKTNDDFLKIMRNDKYLRQFIPLEEYKNNKHKILFKHELCENTFYAMPDKIMNERTNCPYCSGRLGQNYKQRCIESLGSEFVVLSSPKKHTDKVEVEHLVCGNIYSTTCNKILNGRKCPKCKKSSSLEIEVRKVLNNNKIKFTEQYIIDDCRDILPLRFDFALDIDDKLFLIECQGQQHYNEVSIFDSLDNNIRRDNIKKKYCIDKHIPLIIIPYWDIKKSEQLILTSIKNNI